MDTILSVHTTSKSWSISRKGFWFVLIIVVYILGYFLFFPWLGNIILAISLVPVLAIGWVFGMWGGLFCGLVLFPINVLLLMRVPGTDLATLIFRAIPGHIGLLVVGGVVGWMAELQYRLRIQSNMLTQEHKTLQKMLTQQKKAESVLIESEQRFRQLFEYSPDAIFVEDLEGNILDVNPAGCRLHNMSHERLIGINAVKLIPPEKREHFSPSFKELLARGVDRIESVSYSKEGIYIPVEIRIQKIKYNQKPAVLLHVRDISNQKRIQESLAIAFDQALDSHRLQNEFLAKVGSELKNPLHSIRQKTQELQRVNERQQFDGIKNHLEQILESTSELEKLVNLLLDQAKIKAGRMRLDANEFSITDLVERIKKRAEMMARHKDLILQFEIEANVPEKINGDPDRLEQIFDNLINNAIKFTAEGVITTKIYIINDKCWAFKVRDTGPGIPVEAQEKIFDPFIQGDISMSGPYGGTGLGLSVVRELVKMMNGQITVESQVGQGADFTVMLPLESEDTV